MASGVQPRSMNMNMDEVSEEDSVFEMPDRKSFRELEHLTIEELYPPEEGGPLRDAIEFTKQLRGEHKTAPLNLKEVNYFHGVFKLALKKDPQRDGEKVPFRIQVRTRFDLCRGSTCKGASAHTSDSKRIAVNSSRALC